MVLDEVRVVDTTHNERIHNTKWTMTMAEELLFDVLCGVRLYIIGV